MLCESCNLPVIPVPPFGQAIQVLPGFFFSCTGKCRETGVHIESREHGLVAENHHIWSADSGVQVKPFLEYDHSCDTPFSVGRAMTFTPLAPVILRLFEVVSGKMLVEYAWRSRVWCKLQYHATSLVGISSAEERKERIKKWNKVNVKVTKVFVQWVAGYINASGA